jgi:hypothetical protein
MTDFDLAQSIRENGKNGWCGYCEYAAEEIERLRAVLKEISELGDVRCDEAPYMAKRALESED